METKRTNGNMSDEEAVNLMKKADKLSMQIVDNIPEGEKTNVVILALSKVLASHIYYSSIPEKRDFVLLNVYLMMQHELIDIDRFENRKQA